MEGAERTRRASPDSPKPAGARFLGRYRLIAEIGAGATCTAHLARLEGPNGFKRWVTVKALHPHLLDGGRFVDAFLEGARAAARITHPSIASVIEMGRDGDVYWVAAEYVHGEPLSLLLEGARRLGVRVPAAVAFRVMADVADGLHSAHEVRNKTGELVYYVHGALSPTSILVGYDGVVKVVDVGMPKAPSSRAAAAYAAPEVARELRAEPDRRSDVFSLGVILRELCATTGQPLPPRLEAVVKKALEPEPAARFGTTRELSRALSTALLHARLFAETDEIADLMRACFPERLEARQEDLEEAEDATEIFHRTPELEALAAPPPVPPPPSSNGGFDDACETVVTSGLPIMVAPVDVLGAARSVVSAPPAPAARVVTPAALRAPLIELPTMPPVAREDRTVTDALPPPDRSRRGLVTGMLAAGVFLAAATTMVLVVPALRSAHDRTAAAAIPALAPSASASSPLAIAKEPIALSAGPAPAPVATDAGVAAAAVPVVSAKPTVRAAVATKVPAKAGPRPAARSSKAPSPAPARPRVAAPPAAPAADEIEDAEASPPQGLLTVVCYPACDEVIVDKQRLGASPLFKLPITPGSHRLRLRTLDPPVIKTFEVTVRGDEPTVIRQTMAP